MPIVVTDFISTSASDDTYPTHTAELGKGGYRTVDTYTDMEQIPDLRREPGMLVYVRLEDIVYKLDNDLISWEIFNTSSASSTAWEENQW